MAAAEWRRDRTMEPGRKNESQEGRNKVDAGRAQQLTALVAGVLGLFLAGGVALLAIRPPRPSETSAEGDFSIARAEQFIAQLAAVPRPLGSPAHRQARDEIVRHLEELGLETSVQEALVARQWTDSTAVARVANVVARLRGEGTPGAVALIAHYDSRPTTPGAADDASGVAIVLEIVRAVIAGPPLARDLVVLITDAEELGLLGARAFVAEHPWAADVDFVLNLDARGNRGVSLMYETTPANLEIVRELGASAPFPCATSLSQEVYRRMPNDSDFSPFRDFGGDGLNFAFIGGLSAYHTALDRAATVDRRSVAQQGANALALTRALGGRRDPRLRSSGDAVYFSLPGWILVLYPAWWAPAGTLALAIVAALVLADGRRRGSWSPGGVGRGLLLVLGALLSGAAGAWLFWQGLEVVAPFLRSLPHGRPYRTLELAALMALALVAAVSWLAALFEDRDAPLELLAGVLVGWTGLATATSVLLPGGSYLFVWPAAAGWLGWWLACRRGVGLAGALVVTALAAIPGVLLMLPALVLFVEALTLSGAFAPAALFCLLLTLWTPGLARLGSRRAAILPLAAIVGVAAVGAFEARPSAERPRVDSLLYVEDSGESSWLSFDGASDEWTSRFLGERPERRPAPAWLRHDRDVLRAEAQPLTLQPPRLEVVADERGGGRRVTVELESERGAEVVRVGVSTEAGLAGLAVDGQEVELPQGESPQWLVLLGGASPAWRLRFELERDGQVRLEVAEQRFGLPPSVLQQPRPPHLIPSSGWRTDSTFVVRRVEL